jgi:hypothetical protein
VPNPRQAGAHILARLDESTYQPYMRWPLGVSSKDIHMGADHPIIWTRCIGNGRSFYSALGHVPTTYAEPKHMQMLDGALHWAVGPESADPGAHPSRDWLSLAKTSRARGKIRAWLNANERERSLVLGRELVEKELRKFRLSPREVLDPAKAADVLKKLGFATLDDFFAAVGYGKVTPRSLVAAILTVVHTDGSVVSPENPVAAREPLTVYLTGLGSVNANLDCGAAGPSEPLATTLARPQVFLQNAPITVTFSGLTPGFAGLYQVNVLAPSTLPQSPSGALMLMESGQSTSVQLALR